jgi:predicted anti-sigma-YlaC factor YlaD
VSASSTLQCRDMVELMTEFVEGAMPSPQRVRFEEHLAGCPGCRRYLDQIRTSMRLAGRITEEALPPKAWRELLVAFRGWKRSG